jgi:hypothetical protein
VVSKKLSFTCKGIGCPFYGKAKNGTVTPFMIFRKEPNNQESAEHVSFPPRPRYKKPLLSERLLASTNGRGGDIAGAVT